MREYYLQNPLPRAPPGASGAAVESIVGTERFGAEFTAAYHEWLRTGKRERLSALLLETARSLSPGEGAGEGLSKVLGAASRRYLPINEEERARFQALFVRSMTRPTRDVRRE